MPWTALAILFIGFYSRVLRSNVLDTINEDYVRTAEAKGLGERQIMIRHVLRNSMIPIVTLWGLDFGAVVGGGAILTETVFDLQGVGQYAAEAVGQLDVPPVLATTLFAAFFIVLLNAIVDIAYALPRPADPPAVSASPVPAATRSSLWRSCACPSPRRRAWFRRWTACRFELAAGEVLAVVGESGSGKSVTRDDADGAHALAERALRGHRPLQGHRADQRVRGASCGGCAAPRSR